MTQLERFARRNFNGFANFRTKSTRSTGTTASQEHNLNCSDIVVTRSIPITLYNKYTILVHPAGEGGTIG